MKVRQACAAMAAATMLALAHAAGVHGQPPSPALPGLVGQAVPSGPGSASLTHVGLASADLASFAAARGAAAPRGRP